MKFLVVEDDRIFRHKLLSELSLFGEVISASSKDQAIEAFKNHIFDVCFLDLNLSDNDDEFEGLDLIKISKGKGILSIVLSSRESDHAKRESFRKNCDRYIVKKKFLRTPKKYLDPIIESLDKTKLNDFFKNIYITNDLLLIESIKQLQQVVSAGCLSVLITGKTGTGKSLIAKLIHEITVGNKGPFVSLNVGQIPKNLIEAELFGTTKGAFTGAENKTGLLEKVHGGTLFLDEIDSLPKLAQVKIQVALEEGTFMKLGSNQQIKSNFKLITSTCNDLYNLIKSGSLREDFFYRIKGYELSIPSLKDRVDDIPLILKHFMKDMPFEMSISSKAMDMIMSNPWPGNIRQLKDFIYSSQAINNYFIDEKTVQNYFKKNNHISEKSVLSSKLKKLIEKEGLQYLIDQIEKEAITEAVNKAGNLTKASEYLRIGNRRAKRVYNQLDLGVCNV